MNLEKLVESTVDKENKIKEERENFLKKSKDDVIRISEKMSKFAYEKLAFLNNYKVEYNIGEEKNRFFLEHEKIGVEMSAEGYVRFGYYSCDGPKFYYTHELRPLIEFNTMEFQNQFKPIGIPIDEEPNDNTLYTFVRGIFGSVSYSSAYELYNGRKEGNAFTWTLEEIVEKILQNNRLQKAEE